MLYVVNSFYQYGDNKRTYLEHDVIAKELAERAFDNPFKAMIHAEQWHDYFSMIAFDNHNVVQGILCETELKALCYQFVMAMLHDVIELNKYHISIPSFITNHIEMNGAFNQHNKSIAERIMRYRLSLVLNERSPDAEKIELLNFIEFSLSLDMYYSNTLATFVEQLLKYLGMTYIRNRFNDMYETAIKAIRRNNVVLA